jgi:hypothetical protein
VSWLAIRLFLGKLPWKWIALAAALVATHAFAYGQGVKHEKAAQAGREAAARAVVKKIDTKADKITADARSTNDKAQSDIRANAKEIIRNVPIYITREADAQCSVNVGAVRLHDAAAAGHLPQVAGSASELEQPSGLPLSAVIGTVTDNYGTCLGWRQEALTWRGWYEAQAAIH